MSDDFDTSSPDPMVWAEGFVRTFRRHMVDGEKHDVGWIDAGVMVAWFSNYKAAIDAATDDDPPETDSLGRIATHIREAEETLDRARTEIAPTRLKARRDLIAEVDAQARIAHAMTALAMIRPAERENLMPGLPTLERLAGAMERIANRMAPPGEPEASDRIPV